VIVQALTITAGRVRSLGGTQSRPPTGSGETLGIVDFAICPEANLDGSSRQRQPPASEATLVPEAGGLAPIAASVDAAE
jgi:hypothetical protein